MEYVLLSLLIVVFLGLVILGVLVYKLSKKDSTIDTSKSDKELGMLSQQIKSLEDVLKKDIELSLSKEMLQVNETNNQKLERF